MYSAREVGEALVRVLRTFFLGATGFVLIVGALVCLSLALVRQPGDALKTVASSKNAYGGITFRSTMPCASARTST